MQVQNISFSGSKIIRYAINAKKISKINGAKARELVRPNNEPKKKTICDYSQPMMPDIIKMWTIGRF